MHEIRHEYAAEMARDGTTASQTRPMKREDIFPIRWKKREILMIYFDLYINL